MGKCVRAYVCKGICQDRSKSYIYGNYIFGDQNK